MPDPIVIAFANQKGGVGKTTSAVNIAACIAAKGHNVLLADMDPQGNATSGVGISKRSIRHSMYDVLLSECPAAEAVVKTEFKNLSAIPATIGLAGAEFDLLEADNRESALKAAISSLCAGENALPDDEKPEFVIIDCPPSLSMLTINALYASDGVVIPMQCEYFALEGLSQLMVTIKKVKQVYNPTLSITGILVTMYNGRLNLSVQVMNELKKYYGEKLFKATIARNVKVSEAPSFGTPVLYHDKYSKGSLAYMDVAEELLGRVL